MADAPSWNVFDTGAALRGAWSRGEPTFGAWLGIGNAYAAELVGRAGFSWVGIDVQHGMVSTSEFPRMLQALAITRTPALVRVSANAPEEIMRVLDAGANGVIVPLVDSGEDARNAVAACRYPPAGNRSWGASRAALGVYYTAEGANESVICAVMVETREAVAAVDEIAAVPGVDVVFVGPGDLALAHGCAPAVDGLDPALVADITAVHEACARAGVVSGIYAGTVDGGRRWAEAGFRLVAVASDSTMLARGMRSAADAARTGA